MKYLSPGEFLGIQQLFTGSTITTEALGKGVKYVES